MTTNERKSARLRHTLEVARLCGIPYDDKKNPYGGFFDVYQLERISAKIKELEMRIEGLSPKKADRIENGGTR